MSMNEEVKKSFSDYLDRDIRTQFPILDLEEERRKLHQELAEKYAKHTVDSYFSTSTFGSMFRFSPLETRNASITEKKPRPIKLNAEIEQHFKDYCSDKKAYKTVKLHYGEKSANDPQFIELMHLLDLIYDWKNQESCVQSGKEFFDPLHLRHYRKEKAEQAHSRINDLMMHGKPSDDASLFEIYAKLVEFKEKFYSDKYFSFDKGALMDIPLARLSYGAWHNVKAHLELHTNTAPKLSEVIGECERLKKKHKIKLSIPDGRTVKKYIDDFGLNLDGRPGPRRRAR